MKSSFKLRNWEGLATPHRSKTVGDLYIILQHLQDLSFTFSSSWVCENVFISSPHPLPSSYTDSAMRVSLKWHNYMKNLRFDKLPCASINCSHWGKPLSALPLTFPAIIFSIVFFFLFPREQKIKRIYSQKKKKKKTHIKFRV